MNMRPIFQSATLGLMFALSFATSMVRISSGNESKPIAIDSRRELFIDRYLIDRMHGVSLHLHEPRDEGVAFKLSEPWEGPEAGFFTVIRDDDRFLMYYRGISEVTYDGSEHERTCLATSADGLTWTKPQLGFFEFDGSRQNNIVLANAAPASHNLCPMLDSRPDVAPDARFKALGGTLDNLFAFTSPDGLIWRKVQDEPVIKSSDVPIPHIHLFDSQNVPFWSEVEQLYVCYFRVWDGLRRIARTTSRDFVHWTPAVLMEQVHDDGRGPRPAPAEHLYTNQTSPYFRAPHIYVAIAARFFEGRQVINAEQGELLGINPEYVKDISDIVLMSSRGGAVYDRIFLEGYIKPALGANNWTSRTNYPALNVVQTGPAEISLYVNHDYAQPTAHLRRYSIRLDGFASVRAGAEGGEMVTKPFTYTGGRLVINFATSAGGGLRFELQDLDGEPIPGFTLAECQEQIGNEIERVVTWDGVSSVKALQGQVVRMRCVLKDADLFSIQFAP